MPSPRPSTRRRARWLVRAGVVLGAGLLGHCHRTVVTRPGLVVTVTDVPLAEIRGTLATSFGNAEAETWIRLFPVERKYWDEPFGAFARFKNMRVENNSFTLARIPAGEYYLIAVSEGGLEWMDKATLDAMARSAERVRVVNGDKKVLEVRR